MAKKQYIGIGGVARQVKKQHIGVGGVARKIKMYRIEKGTSDIGAGSGLASDRIYLVYE